MKKTALSSVLVLCLFGLFVCTVYLSERYAQAFRWDTSEDKMYQLTAGTHKILGGLSEPITVDFYYSKEAFKGQLAVSKYAEYVGAILREYAVAANGNIVLNTVSLDTHAAQNSASALGLKLVSNYSAGFKPSTGYFGLVASKGAEPPQVIAEFVGSRKRVLEHELSQLIHQVAEPAPLVLTVLSDLPLGGSALAGNAAGLNTQTPYAIYTYLQTQFTTQLIGSDATSLPANTNVLMIVHPQAYSPRLLYQIDQFLMSGGKALVFTDPHFESDANAMQTGLGKNQSSLPLLASYGVQVANDLVVLDAMSGLDIRTANGGVSKHYGFLGLSGQQIEHADVATIDVASINGASFGSIKLSSEGVSALLHSSSYSYTMPVDEYALAESAAALEQRFVDEDTKRVLAVRVHKSAQSHFTAAAAPVRSNHISSTKALNLVVVADVDILADRFWGEYTDTIYANSDFRAFANNADFIQQIISNLGGSEWLIGMPAKAQRKRPMPGLIVQQSPEEDMFKQQDNTLQRSIILLNVLVAPLFAVLLMYVLRRLLRKRAPRR